MFLCAASQRHCLRYALALFPTLTGTGTISGSLGHFTRFTGYFHGKLPVPKVKRETPGARTASK